MIASKNIISPNDYCQNYLNIKTTIEMEQDALRRFLDSNGFSNLWDYPLDEIDEICGNSINAVLVDTSYKLNETVIQEVRWFEIPTK